MLKNVKRAAKREVKPLLDIFLLERSIMLRASCDGTQSAPARS